MFLMLPIKREFEQCFPLIWNQITVQNEISVQEELANKTDNHAVSYKLCTGRKLKF